LMVIFIVAVAAAEAVIAMAVFVSLFRARKTVDITQQNQMKG
jgi:NADH:ubiquinone oxidoreductase subunit K